MVLCLVGNPWKSIILSILYHFQFSISTGQKRHFYIALCEVMGGGDGWRVAATSVKPTSPTENRSVDGRSTSTHCEGFGTRRCGSCSIQAESCMHLCQRLRGSSVLLDVFCGERILFQIMALAEVGELFRMGSWMEWKSKSFRKTCQ